MHAPMMGINTHKTCARKSFMRTRDARATDVRIRGWRYTCGGVRSQGRAGWRYTCQWLCMLGGIMRVQQGARINGDAWREVACAKSVRAQMENAQAQARYVQ